jgi:hypothetical protein
MSEMGNVYDLAQSGVSQRHPDVKEKAMDEIFQQRPDHESQREEPEQVIRGAMWFGLRCRVQQGKAEQGENPEGAKTIQPLFQSHGSILSPNG